MRPAAFAFLFALLAAGSRPASAEAPPETAPDKRRWCASELAALPNEVCYFVPEKPAPGPRTLIIHLHGVVQPDTNDQWNSQRNAARVGATYGHTVIMPRGRRGIGPKTMESWWAWPTSMDARRIHEDALVAEWTAARTALEQAAGKPFERVYIFGFSNGAYYATSLAMRGRLDVAGYALFAGGSGAPYHETEAKGTKKRAPIVVAWGAGDPSHDKQKALAKMLKRMRWPHLEIGRPRAGHAMTDEQVEKALAFLGSH
ncbi:dienelactone hydrolase family protein [Polyangium sp. y55x31]|uniref:alpha/beta hydrolase n=1 Tax=Polyangium sp. y55x31 TaxID=3042688 RepID=UPI0024826144|nr:dienelactone hydrolase family protein [Polyangium sp. y55x31]MDI1483671.1 dienelactone hydrolase family protein [Polyangium sp. y55x31]